MALPPRPWCRTPQGGPSSSKNELGVEDGSETHRDLVQLGSMNAVGGCGDVPVVEENSSALVRRDSYVNLHQIKVKRVGK